MDSEHTRMFCEQVVTKIARENGFEDPRLQLAAGSKAGDNYVGRLIRCAVKDDKDPHKEMHLMLKVPPENEEYRKKYRVDSFFITEAKMYGNILPALADCYKKRGLLQQDGVFPGTARSYGLIVNEAGGGDMAIVMEDVSKKGFVMQDRQKGLDEDHCRLVLRGLAKLHAASLALQRDNPDLHEELSQQLKENVFNGQVSPSFKIALDSCRTMIDDRFPEGTTERNKFENFAASHEEILVNAVKRSPVFCAITHGDLWVNNLLFKYDEGSTVPQDIRFVDLQVSRMASPVLDLSYFICLCTRKNTRLSYEKFMKYYFECLSKSLSDLGHDIKNILSWDVFQEELRKYGAYGFGAAVRILPMTLFHADEIEGLEKTIIKNIQEKEKGSSFILPKSPIVQQLLIDLVEDMVRLGWF